MNSAQLILIDKRNQPLKDYIVAVAASDGLDIKGVQVIASPAKGQKPLLTAGLRIPPLEDFEFDTQKIAQYTLDQLLIEETVYDCETFISQATDDQNVCEQFRKSKHKLALAIEALISEFTQSSVTDLIRDNRNDALYKLKQQAKDLKNKTILCLDIEATDISTNLEADIIQFSVCDLDGNEQFNQLFNPGYAIPPNEKHAITTEMVVDAPAIEAKWAELHQLLSTADIILAYSTESDFNYLKNTADKKQLPFELDYAKWLDVAELSKELVGAMRWHSERMHWFWKTPKLTMAYERILNKPFPGDAHDALADARATAELMQAMLSLGAKSDIKAKETPKADAKVSNNLFALAFANAKKRE